MPRRPPPQRPTRARSALWRLRWRIRTAARGRPRLVTAILLGVAVTAALAALRPPPPPVRTVDVAARDLPAGQRLAQGDLRRAALPTDMVPAGALPSVALVGRTLAAAVRRGETVPAVRLVGAGLALAAGADRAAVPVRVPDEVAALLLPGDVVDLLAPPADTSSGAEPSAAGGTVVAHGARVVAAPDAAPSGTFGTGSSGQGRLIVVAVPQDEAEGTASAAAAAILWPVLRPQNADPPARPGSQPVS